MEMMGVKTVAITRSGDDAREFVARAEEGGMHPIPLPTIRLVERGGNTAGEFLEEVRRYDPDYCVFMSSKAVRLLFDSARRASVLDQLLLAVANTTVVAVGPVTKATLAEQGIRANHMPERTFSSVGIGEVFSGLGAPGRRVLVPRSAASTPFLRELLQKMGLDVREVLLYDVQAVRDDPAWDDFAERLSQSAVDGMIFTSASSVRAFFEIMEGYRGRSELLADLGGLEVVAIGPFTADELTEFGVSSAVAQAHTVRGAFDALSNILSWKPEDSA